MNKDRTLTFGTLLAILLFCNACTGLTSDSSGLNRRKVDYSITSDIISRHHPRIVFFYNPESEPCKQLEVELIKTLTLYGDFFDTQYVNANDTGNHKLSTEFHVSDLPNTFIFDNQGNQVFNQVGPLDHKTLSNILKTVYLDEYKDYEAEKNQKSESTKKNEANKPKASSKTNMDHNHH